MALSGRNATTKRPTDYIFVIICSRRVIFVSHSSENVYESFYQQHIPREIFHLNLRFVGSFRGALAHPIQMDKLLNPFSHSSKVPFIQAS